MKVLRRLWNARWPILRLLLAGVLLALFLADRPAHTARLSLAALPDVDPVQEVADLRAQGRLADSILAADAAQAWAPPITHYRLDEQRRLTQDLQTSWLRRAQEVGLGALTGRGDSLERLIGAISADLFLVGDLRDLAIEAFNQTTTGDSDEIIVLLSTAGVLTSLAPQADWAPALAKAARKSGAFSQSLGNTLLASLRAGRWTDARAVVDPLADLARHTTPATALRLLPAAADPADLARLARFAESSPVAAAALRSGGKEAAEILLRTGPSADAAVTLAARKGPRLLDHLKGPARAALRPHPILGLAKGLWKGNLTALAQRAVERLSPHGWWIIPLLALWTFAEILLVVRRLRGP